MPPQEFVGLFKDPEFKQLGSSLKLMLVGHFWGGAWKLGSRAFWGSLGGGGLGGRRGQERFGGGVGPGVGNSQRS